MRYHLLATDYDGTLAADGEVAAETVAALFVELRGGSLSPAAAAAAAEAELDVGEVLPFNAADSSYRRVRIEPAERDRFLSRDNAIAALRAAIESRYTLPAGAPLPVPGAT